MQEKEQEQTLRDREIQNRIYVNKYYGQCKSKIGEMGSPIFRKVIPIFTQAIIEASWTLKSLV